jgi:plastocyanin
MSREKVLVAALLVFCATSMVQCSSGGGGGTPTAPSIPQTVIISIVDNAFSPRSPVISPGQTVRWVMNGMNPGHTSTEMGGTWDSGFVFNAQGNFFERTFPASENGQTFEYFCITHQTSDAMQGSIRVGQGAPDPRDGY